MTESEDIATKPFFSSLNFPSVLSGASIITGGASEELLKNCLAISEPVKYVNIMDVSPYDLKILEPQIPSLLTSGIGSVASAKAIDSTLQTMGCIPTFATQALQPTSLFLDTKIDTTELLKDLSSSILASDFIYKDHPFDSLKITGLDLHDPSLSFSLEPVKSIEQIRNEALESKIEELESEIQELKELLLKSERKRKQNVGSRNAKLRKLLDNDDALELLCDMGKKIKDEKEMLSKESTSDQSKDVYPCYG